MPELSKDLVALLQYLAPGFVVAWVFFGLTSHNKPSQFERVVQALIFTVIVQLLVKVEESLLFSIGEKFSLGTWTETSKLVAALSTAILCGFAFASFANNDVLHQLGRRFGFTSRTSHPCEWFGIFKEYPRFIALHLKDGTRIFGWPQVWPSEPSTGHFFITSAIRIIENSEQDLGHLEGILVDVKDIAWVEFVKQPEEKIYAKSETDSNSD